jgi:hypothetical protein
MKSSLSGRAFGAIAAAAMLLPFAAFPAAAQVPGGSYLQSCRDAHMRGDRLVATCRTEEGGWSQTSIGNVGQCAGGVANSDGRLVCGTRGGGVNSGNQREPRRDSDRDYGWRGDRDYGRDGYGGSWNRGRDDGGRWDNGPGWGPGYYGR